MRRQAWRDLLYRMGIFADPALQRARAGSRAIIYCTRSALPRSITKDSRHTKIPDFLQEKSDDSKAHKMLKYENECVGACEPCIGCKYKKPQPHFYCDRCHDEIDGAVYQYINQDLCGSCLLDVVPKVETADELEERIEKGRYR